MMMQKCLKKNKQKYLSSPICISLACHCHKPVALKKKGFFYLLYISGPEYPNYCPPSLREFPLSSLFFFLFPSLSPVILPFSPHFFIFWDIDHIFSTTIKTSYFLPPPPTISSSCTLSI